MSPLRATTLLRSPILRQQLRQNSGWASAAPLKSSVRTQAAWGAQWKRVGGSAVMFFPVVGVVMFWPYVVPPVMDYVEARL